MSGPITELAHSIPNCCHANHCDRDGCRVSLDGTPPVRVIIDMDCKELGIQDDQNRCDYLFVGEQSNTTWVVPIELKSGKVKSVSAVLSQLEGGAITANDWLPQGISFQLVPVLAHGKSIHRNDLNRLRSVTIQLRGKKRRITLLKCGD